MEILTHEEESKLASLRDNFFSPEVAFLASVMWKILRHLEQQQDFRAGRPQASTDRGVTPAEEGSKVMSHTCHATGCTQRVPPQMFMCKRHWFSLPKAMRDRIWATYRPGQCDDWRISHEYAEAARAAVKFIAAREGKSPDLSVYDMLDPKEK